MTQPTGFKGTHNIVWPIPPVNLTRPLLITGLTQGQENFIADLCEWESEIVAGDLVKYCNFLRDAKLPESDNPMEAVAWENGFVPEGKGLPAVDVEKRIQGSLPHLAYMVSRLSQSNEAGEEILRRYDTATRPYWLRDWQSGFGGYTKVYEYHRRGETKRMFSVAYVRPRTATTDSASLCCQECLTRSHG